MSSLPHLSDNDAVALLERAFAGVTLGAGVSLRQAQLLDDMDYDPDHRYAAARARDEVDDWRRIPRTDLETLSYLAHVDAEGFRFYLPALLCSLIRDYDDTAMRVIQTLYGLCPTEKNWDHCMERYAVLDAEQMAAVATVLSRLSSVVDLTSEDATIVRRALRDYWNHFLPDATGVQPV